MEKNELLFVIGDKSIDCSLSYEYDPVIGEYIVTLHYDWLGMKVSLVFEGFGAIHRMMGRFAEQLETLVCEAMDRAVNADRERADLEDALDCQARGCEEQVVSFMHADKGAF